MCQWRWRLLKKQQLEMAGFEQTQEIIILKRMRIMFVMISMICVSCSIVILDRLNTFIKNYNYFKSKVNNILSIIYKNDLITCCCFKCTEMLFSHWFIWRWRLLNKHYRFRKMEMEVFVKIPDCWYSCI